MTLKNLKQLNLISIVALLYYNCYIEDSIHGKWVLAKTHFNVSEEFRYLEKSDPGFMEEYLSKRFPKKIQAGGEVEFLNDTSMTINKIETFYYRFSEQYFEIINSDIIYNFEYSLENDTLRVFKIVDQGSGLWLFIRK